MGLQRATIYEGRRKVAPFFGQRQKMGPHFFSLGFLAKKMGPLFDTFLEFAIFLLKKITKVEGKRTLFFAKVGSSFVATNNGFFQIVKIIIILTFFKIFFKKK